MAAPKKPTLIFEMGGKQITLNEIETAVKAVKGTKTAYINVTEAAAYCVDNNNNTTKISLGN